MALAVLASSPAIAEIEDAGDPEADAGVEAAPTPMRNIEEVDLADLLGVVVSASKKEQRVEDAPAIIEIITAEKIAARGYLTVAEAVADVPGIYVVDDHFIPNIGVRGVNAGQRSWSRILKVLIDGQPVSYRNEGANWTGLELIPLSAVQRIEVLRGPASALFGADAFLGVINIITRTGPSIGGGRVEVRGHLLNYNPGVSGEGVAGGEVGTVQFLASATAGRLDRSGLTVPSTYPNFKPERYQAPDGVARRTRDDVAVPVSAYGKLELTNTLGTFSLSSHFQQLTSGANFEDWQTLPLEPSTLAQHNLFVRGQWSAPSKGTHGFHTSIAFATGEYHPDDHLELGDPVKFYQRRSAYRALDVNLEYSFTPSEENGLRAGVDFSYEWHNLLRYVTVLKEDTGIFKKGEVIPLGTRRTLFLPFLGAYLQGTWAPLERLLLTVGGRVDAYQSEGTFEVVPSARAAAVWRFTRGVTAKVLYGRSFKSPSPLLRYAPGGLGVTDILGNPQLQPETADTVEVGGTFAPASLPISAQGAAFFTSISNFSEFVNAGQNFIARNTRTATTAGFELEATYHASFADFSAHYAFAGATRPFDSTSFFASTDDAETGLVRLPLYPEHVLRASVTAPIERLYLQLYVSAGYVSERRASDTSILANNRRVYTLRAWAPVDVALSSHNVRLLGKRETKVMLKVTDVLNQRAPEPGFGGADVPALGRQWMLSLSQEW